VLYVHHKGQDDKKLQDQEVYMLGQHNILYATCEIRLMLKIQFDHSDNSVPWSTTKKEQ
jgi:hypothetical protein